MVKWRIRSRFGVKFKTVAWLSFLSLFVFAVAFLTELIWLGRAGAQGEIGGEAVLPLFRYLFCRQLLYALLLFLLGVTVYAPAALFCGAALHGFSTGFVLAALCPTVFSFRGVLAFAAAALYLFSLAFLQTGYGSFLAGVSLAMFSPPPVRSSATLFGGSLFYSRYFCQRVNLRFLGSYLLFFLFYLTCIAALTFFYALLCVVL